ncbi:MAG: DsrE family protein [Flavobacteriaceae bacterium]|nr:DsrE family protein [Flavobacteriaceae bacterium]
MKNLFLITFLLVSALFASSGLAQNTMHHKKNNYVVLTKKIPQLNPIILTAKALAVEDGNKFGDFQVIICGKTVTDLTDKEMMQKFIDDAKKANVKIVICGISLKQFGVGPKDIPQELEVVGNGILHNFQLQKKGYLSIEL